jgi:hypothetical protein
MVVHPSCEILIGGLAGGICYAKGTDANPRPEAPIKDGYYEHIHDALGYGVINVFSIEEKHMTGKHGFSRPKNSGRIIRSPEELYRDLKKPGHELMCPEVMEDGWKDDWS